MRLALLIHAFVLFCASAIAADDADVPTDLRDADYITAVDVEAEVPHGQLFIDRAVVAIFPRLEDRLGGMVIGNTRLEFTEPQATQAGTQQGSERRVVFRIERAFLSASLRSEVKVLPKGRALAARRWSGLTKKEQQEFLDLYTQASASSWFEEGAAAGETNPAATPRDPRAGEFFTAFWARSPRRVVEALSLLEPGAEPRSPSEVVRFDFRVSESGGDITLLDHTSGLTLLKLSGT